MWCRILVFCFKQKTAYEMRISDWSSDVCSSDLVTLAGREAVRRDHRIVDRENIERIAVRLEQADPAGLAMPRTIVAVGDAHALRVRQESGRASGRERVCRCV